jgi:hypothetical protein
LRDLKVELYQLTETVELWYPNDHTTPLKDLQRILDILLRIIVKEESQIQLHPLGDMRHHFDDIKNENLLNIYQVHMIAEAYTDTDEFAVLVLVNMGVVEILIELMIRQEFYASNSAAEAPQLAKKKISYQIHDILGRMCLQN